MISKIQPISFRSRIHMDRETARAFSSSKTRGIEDYKTQLEKIRDNGNNDVVIFKRSTGLQYDYLKLQILTKDGKTAEAKTDFWYITHSPWLNIGRMYNKAEEKLNNSEAEESTKKVFEFYNI